MDLHRIASADGLLLVGHGSRDLAGNEAFLHLANALAASADLPLQPCFLEFAAPDVLCGIAALVAQGCRRIAVQPLMLFAAGHVTRDIPQLLAAAREAYPHVSFRYGQALGVQPLLVEALCDQLRTVERDFPGVPASTAILFVGRGAEDPAALAQCAEIGRQVAAVMGYQLQFCYLGLAQPDVDTGLQRVRALGVARVLVIPYLFFPGKLLTRLRGLVDAAGDERCRFVLAGTAGLAAHPNLAALVAERFRTLAAPLAAVALR